MIHMCCQIPMCFGALHLCSYAARIGSTCSYDCNLTAFVQSCWAQLERAAKEAREVKEEANAIGAAERAITPKSVPPRTRDPGTPRERRKERQGRPEVRVPRVEEREIAPEMCQTPTNDGARGRIPKDSAQVRSQHNPSQQEAASIVSEATKLL